ncbi:response regulator [bacterium]|nr:response regulator [bacterium]
MNQKRVLVADDSPVDRTILAKALGRWGYDVEVAEDGQQAVEILRRESDIRLAVIDWAMPGLEGPDVCRAAQKLDRFVYIFVLTGRTKQEGMPEALTAGASDFISKPFHAAELEARLRAASRILDLQGQISDMQKMDSIGRLAAGVAHEINTPIQYVGDNTRFLEGAYGELLGLFESARTLLGRLVDGAATPEEIARVAGEWRDSDFEYLSAEIPRAVSESLEGLEQVSSIVAAMKEFSHPGSDHPTPTDLHPAIESTITVARNEWKYRCRMETGFDPEMPLVPCLVGDLKQVLLNLIVNAAHAIAEREDEGQLGTITIATKHDGKWAEIRVSDTGNGIPPEIRRKVFEPFFTTKEPGRGTGQGLALAHNVIKRKHGGTIEFETETGVGTTFIIRLPLESANVSAETEAVG